MSDSSSSGTVLGYSRVGGLVGENREGTITHSTVSSSVTGTGCIGGLVGENRGNVLNSSFNGNVTDTDDEFDHSYALGGLAGSNYQGTVTGSFASGSVSGYRNVGGLAGDNFS